MNILCAVLIMSLILGIGGFTTNKIGDITPDGPAAMAGLKVGEEIIFINGNPVETWNDVLTNMPENDSVITVTVNGKDGVRDVEVQPALTQVKDENGNVTSVQRSVVEVKFLKDNTTTWGYITILNVGGEQYLQLDFNNSMVRFAGERYLDIQFLIDDTSGLKIPSSSITKKDFFIIPEAYVMKGGADDADGFPD